MNIPDGMPTLAKGGHSPDSGRACVMEYVALIKGEKWGDEPQCVDPRISEMMRGLNDSIHDDEERSRLLVPLIGKVMACIPQRPNTVEILFQEVGETLSGWRCPCGDPCCKNHARTVVYVCCSNQLSPAQRASVAERVLDAFIERFGLTEEPVQAEALIHAENIIKAEYIRTQVENRKVTA